MSVEILKVLQLLDEDVPQTSISMRRRLMEPVIGSKAVCKFFGAESKSYGEVS